MKEIFKKFFTIEYLKELFMYGIGGVGTMLLNVVMYRLLLFIMDYRIANLITLVVTKLAAYVWNKLYVFRTKNDSFKEFMAEFSRYVLARGFTGLVDYFGLIFAVEVLAFDKIYSKYALQIVVIILNYILGKLAVFKKKDNYERIEEKDKLDV